MKSQKKPTDKEISDLINKIEKDIHKPLFFDGSGALYFVARQPQATKMTRQEMRESSPSGVVRMDRMLGRSFTYRFLTYCIASAVAAMIVIQKIIPLPW